MIMLDDMTESNGPTRVVPGSHNWVPLNVPDVNMAEVTHIEIRPEERPKIPADPKATYPGEVRLTGKAGSVAVINGHIWHGERETRAALPGKCCISAIGRRDIPQQLVEREHLTDDSGRRRAGGAFPARHRGRGAPGPGLSALADAREAAEMVGSKH